MNSHEVFSHIHQGCFAGTGAIVRLPQCQWSKPVGYGKISQCITQQSTAKQKPCAYFLGYTVPFDIVILWNAGYNHEMLQSILIFLDVLMVCCDWWSQFVKTQIPYHCGEKYHQSSICVLLQSPILMLPISTHDKNYKTSQSWYELHATCGRYLVLNSELQFLNFVLHSP